MKNLKILTPNQMEDARRLKALYESKKKSLGITQQDIADALDVTQGAVGHYLNGRNALNLSAALTFSRILNVPVSEFSPTLAKEVNSATVAASDKNVTYDGPYDPKGRYPMLSWVSAGEWNEAVEPYSINEINEWYESDVPIQGSGFWLKVEGDSMTAPIGQSIPEGHSVLVDTGREAKNGSLVVAKLTDANEATFKKLVVDGGQRYLKGLNPAWPMIPINGNCRIIGVVVESKVRYV